MKVLVLGQGAREHAICYLLSQSRLVEAIYACEGNAGIASLGQSLWDVNPNKPKEVVNAVREYQVDCVIVGAEAPAEAGTVDALQAQGIPVFGPNQRAAQLETSKVFAKHFLRRYQIPTAQSVEFTNLEDFYTYVKAHKGLRLVVKKNGLAAGKGVLESDNSDELLAFGKGILALDSLLVEEYLSGWEVSVFALADGRDYKLLLPCADHKKAYANDLGPNTGGMGAICPVPQVTEELALKIEREIVAPTFKGMAAEGIFYQGVLYFGLMITAQGPKVLEYNIRFGDPEAQVLLPLLATDFGEIVEAVLNRRLGQLAVKFKEQSALGVVVAAEGYPGAYAKDLEVEPIDPPSPEKALIFHAATRFKGRPSSPEKQILTGGGRCFTVVGLGCNLEEAFRHAYQHVARIRFKGAWYRPDIGKKYF